MDNISGNYFSTIEYNNNSIKTNTLNMALLDAIDSSKVKFNLTVSTAGMDAEGIQIFGRGELINYTIRISNFSGIDLTGISQPISGWGGVTAIPIVLTFPSGLNLKDYTNDDTPVGEGNPYVLYTENGETQEMIRVRSHTDWSDGMYAFRMIQQAAQTTCTFLLPLVPIDTSIYIKFIAEGKDTISLGDIFTANATLAYKENEPNPALVTEDVTVKYAYTDVFAEKKAPASVHYGDEFSYEIVITNSGNIPAVVNKISDLLPQEFTISTNENSEYKINVKCDEKDLKKDTDYSVTVATQTGLIEIVPLTEGKLDIAENSKITVTITGKIIKDKD